MKTLFELRLAPAISAFLFVVASASAKTIYVNRNASGANNGTSWVNAFTTLQAAMAASVSGDQVWIAAGTYRPNDSNPTNLIRTQAFQMKNGVTIHGGFSGGEMLLTQRNAAANPVILSGDLLGNDSAVNTYAVSSSASTTDNVYNVFKHSSVSLNSSAALEDVTIRGGNANGVSPDDSGGAMINSFSSPTLVNCLLVDNAANRGGAISNFMCSPKLTGCALLFNTAGSQGGAIYNSSSSSSPSVTAPILTNCTLSNNSATAGGAILNLVSTITLINCTVAYNSSAFVAPGSGNPSGSAIRSATSSDKSRQSFIFLTNCILWGNANSVQLWGGNTTASSCIIEGGFVGPLVGVEDYNLSNIFASDPLISQLGNYGGGTPSIVFPPTSPAINAGITTAQTPALDQRGFPRDPQPDIGASEYPIYVGAGFGGPAIAIGASANLPVSTVLPSPTYQWYRGPTGDTSNPIPGASGDNYSTPPLELGADYWVAVTSGGSMQASPTISVPVRGTYGQWTTFHGLLGDDADASACPANDDIPNLVKYATGIDPSVPAAQSNYLQLFPDALTGNLNLDLTLSRTPTDLSWSILESQDNSTWSPVVGSTSPTVTSTARQTQRLSVPVGSGKDFIKARFEKGQ